MKEELLMKRLLRILLLFVACICAGTILELIFAEHTGEVSQFVPFVLSALGLLATGAVWFRPQRQSLLVFRIVMVLMAAGSALGVFLHFTHNFEFELEINQTAEAAEVIIPALFGASPILAPGIMLLAGALGLLAAYYHPGLGSKSGS